MSINPTDTTTVSDSSTVSFGDFKDLAASLVTSAYKWLTSTLLAAQQSQTTRPYFTCKIIDDTIQPSAQLSSGSGPVPGNGSMVTAPDGTVYGAYLSGNNIVVGTAPDLNASVGTFPTTITIDSAASLNDSRNIVSIACSDWYRGNYKLQVWYYDNFVNDGTNLTIVEQYSLDGGLTWSGRAVFTPSNFANNNVGNLALSAFTPVLDSSGSLNGGCFYIKKNSGAFSSGFTGYDIYYIYGASPGGGFVTDVVWNLNVNSFDWTIHSLAAYVINGTIFCVFAGFRNVIDTPGVNQNFSLWVTSIVNRTGSSGSDLWASPTAILPVGSASTTNFNSFTYPTASVVSGTVRVVVQATLVDSLAQTSQGVDAQVVTTHTNYILLQSDNGTGFSYPSVLVGTNGTEFSSGGPAFFIAQSTYWYLGGALNYLWQYVQKNVVADVSADVIGYNIQEQAGQPSSVQVQIANQNNQWVGSSPTNPGAAAIARNRKIAIWQGFYNASGVPEVVPHTVYFIDDIQQTVTSTRNDVTIVGRDLYKKMKTTVTKFAYQLGGPTFFTDIFDGTFMSSWNQITGEWAFLGSVNPPLLEREVGSGGEDKIMYSGSSNGNTYGHIMRVFFRYDTAVGAKAYFYAFYIDDNNWLRLELNCQDGQSWAVVSNINGSTSTRDSGTMPFTMSAASARYYGVYIRRYDYYKWQFMINNQTSANLGNELFAYDPATTSYVFKSGGTGEYDMSSSFQTSSSLQTPFTVGMGVTQTGVNKFRFFMFAQLNNPNTLGEVMRRISRIAGIFAFKLTYTWRELMFTNNFTGAFTIKNRLLRLVGGSQALNTGTLSNGEVSFLAKVDVTDIATPAGFSFVFRYVPSGDIDGEAAQYNFHVIQQSTGFSNAPVSCRFERWSQGLNTTFRFYNTPWDVSNNPYSGINLPGSVNLDLTKWNLYRIVMIDGWFYAFVNDQMVAAWNDNNTTADYITSGLWGFSTDANTTLQVKQILAPNFWKPIQSFLFNPGDDADSSIESLIQQLRAWFFSDLFGRFKAVFLGSGDASTYTYNLQLYQQQVDQSDKEYVSQVTVYGSGVIATARNTNLMPGVQTREMVVVDYTITTQQDAQTRANNEIINAGQYLNQYTPRQVINVGAEMFDAVTVINTGNNTSGVNGTTRVYAQSFTEGGGTNNGDYMMQLSTGTL